MTTITTTAQDSYERQRLLVCLNSPVRLEPQANIQQIAFNPSAVHKVIILKYKNNGYMYIYNKAIIYMAKC